MQGKGTIFFAVSPKAKKEFRPESLNRRRAEYKGEDKYYYLSLVVKLSGEEDNFYHLVSTLFPDLYKKNSKNEKKQLTFFFS